MKHSNERFDELSEKLNDAKKLELEIDQLKVTNSELKVQLARKDEHEKALSKDLEESKTKNE